MYWITPRPTESEEPLDPNGIISAEDTSSTSANNGSYITGAPSRGSSVQAMFPAVVGVGSIPMDGGMTGSLSNESTATISTLVDPGWSGALQIEISVDGGISWIPSGNPQLTGNAVVSLQVPNAYITRLRAVTPVTGTAKVWFNFWTLVVPNNGRWWDPTQSRKALLFED